MNIDEICSYRVDCCGCPKENNCLFLEKKAKEKAEKEAKKNMTIKELCCKYPICDNCPFNRLCSDALGDFNDDANNEAITKAIIETARILQEDKNND